MKRIALASIFLTLCACASIAGRSGERSARLELWREAHEALQASQFARADTLFGRLSREFAGTETGRESLFYLGTLRLDPRNPGWDPQRSEAALTEYLSADSTPGVHINRRAEGQTLFEIARQLNMPAEDRIEGLQPETRTRVERVVVRGGEVGALNAEIRRLRQQVESRDRQIADREGQIRRQAEELDRIRKTLTGPRRR